MNFPEKHFDPDPKMLRKQVFFAIFEKLCHYFFLEVT